MEGTSTDLRDNPQWKAGMDAILMEMAALHATIDVLIGFMGLDRRRLNKLLTPAALVAKRNEHFNLQNEMFSRRYQGMLVAYADIAKRRKP